MQDLQALAEYTRRWMDEYSLSTHKVSQRSGGAISHSTVGNILNSAVKEVKESTLAALAVGLGRPQEEVFAAARGKALEFADPLEEVRILFSGWDEASEQDRASTMEAIRMIAETFQRRRRKVNNSGRAAPAEVDKFHCVWCGKLSRGGVCDDCCKSLKGSPKMAQAKLNDLPYGAIELNADGTVLAFNKAEEELSRLSHKTIIGKNFFTQVAPCSDVKEFHGRFDAFMLGDRPIEEFDFTYRFPRGRIEYVRLTIMRVDDKRAVITSQKRVQADRRRSA